MLSKLLYNFFFHRSHFKTTHGGHIKRHVAGRLQSLLQLPRNSRESRNIWESRNSPGKSEISRESRNFRVTGDTFGAYYRIFNSSYERLFFRKHFINIRKNFLGFLSSLKLVDSCLQNYTRQSPGTVKKTFPKRSIHYKCFVSYTTLRPANIR